MSAIDDSSQRKVDALRGLGHDEAADDLAALYAGEAEAAAEREKQQRGRPGLPLLDIGPAELQRQAEGRVLLGELERFQGDRGFHGSMPLLDRNDQGDNR